jgi:hypothetical protein
MTIDQHLLKCVSKAVGNGGFFASASFGFGRTMRLVVVAARTDIKPRQYVEQLIEMKPKLWSTTILIARPAGSMTEWNWLDWTVTT